MLWSWRTLAELGSVLKKSHLQFIRVWKHLCGPLKSDKQRERFFLVEELVRCGQCGGQFPKRLWASQLSPCPETQSCMCITGQPPSVRLWGDCHRGFPLLGLWFLWIHQSLWSWWGYWEWGWESYPYLCCSCWFIPHAKATEFASCVGTTNCLCHLPPIPEMEFSVLPCLLSVILTHQKLTKLLSPKFLLIRDHDVRVILVISTFIKI